MPRRPAARGAAAAGKRILGTGEGYQNVEAANAKEFARISADLLAEPQEPATLRSIVEGVVETVPACDFASISLRMKGGNVETPVSTSPIVDVCDENPDPGYPAQSYSSTNAVCPSLFQFTAVFNG